MFGFEEAQENMDFRGICRGVVFKTDEEFIIREKGLGEVKQVEARLNAFGCPLIYEKIKTMDFYPLKWRIASLVAIKNQFNFSNDKIKEMGMTAPKFSLITKIFIKYFSSISLMAEQAPSIWKRHYREGELTVAVINENSRLAILKLTNLNIDPLFCVYLSGYFSTMLQMVTGSTVICRETKCFYSGDDFHEYELTW